MNTRQQPSFPVRKPNSYARVFPQTFSETPMLNKKKNFFIPLFQSDNFYKMTKKNAVFHKKHSIFSKFLCSIFLEFQENFFQQNLSRYTIGQNISTESFISKVFYSSI